jgi:hypothetical protein
LIVRADLEDEAQEIETASQTLVVETAPDLVPRVEVAPAEP